MVLLLAFSIINTVVIVDGGLNNSIMDVIVIAIVFIARIIIII